MRFTDLRRRFRPAALVAALPVALAAALVLGVTTLAPTASAEASGKADVRAAIASAAISQIGKREQPVNLYPIAYKINDNIVRPAAWCGVFANWAWWKGGATKRPNMTGSGVNQGHWATYWQKWGKANDRWKPLSRRNPAKGDAVVYGNFPDSVHVGIVVDVRKDSAGKVTKVRSVEGNLSDMVKDTGWRNIGSLTGGGESATGFVSPV
jgi:hypothetical protein